MAQARFNKKAVDPATAKKLGTELHAEVIKPQPDPARIKQLVADGADMELRDSRNNTVLIAATMKGRETTAILLADLGAAPDAEGDGGVTALLVASFAGSKGFIDLTKKLLDKGVNPDKGFFGGKTALMWAAQRGFRDVASEIANRGGDIKLKSTDGRHLDAIEWAEDNNKKGAADMLRDIQSRKEAEAERKTKAEQQRDTALAAQVAKVELQVAIKDAVTHHRDLVSPERAQFKKRVPKTTV